MRLTALIEELAANPDMITAARDAIRQDRWIWAWSWQPELFREEVTKMVTCPAYTPPDDLAYLPERVLRFERRRRSRELDRETGRTAFL